MKVKSGLAINYDTARENEFTNQPKQYSFANECNSQMDLEIYHKTSKHRTILHSWQTKANMQETLHEEI
jgi:hypothetical protein